MRLKWLSYIFIPIFCILLMSHNTFAYDVGRDVQLQGYSGFHFNGVYANPSAFSMLDNDKCIRATGTTAITSWGMITNTLSLQAGDFVQIWFSIGINAENNSSDTMIRGLAIQGTSYQTVDVSYESVNPSNGIVRITMRVKDTFSTDTFVVSTQNPFMVLYNNEYVYAGAVSVWRPLVQQSNQDIVNAINNMPDYTNQINNMNNTIVQQQQAEQDAVDNIEDQTPSDISDSGGSGENTTTTSLLNTLTSFVTALQNINTSGNCVVTMAMPSFAGGSFNVNVCQNKEYTGNIVSIGGSVLLVFFYLPVAYMLVAKIYSEIRSFTNG